MKSKNIKIERDTFLEGLYSTLDMCNLIIDNYQVLSPDRVATARHIKTETIKNIVKYEKNIGEKNAIRSGLR